MSKYHLCFRIPSCSGSIMQDFPPSESRMWGTNGLQKVGRQSAEILGTRALAHRLFGGEQFI